MSRDETNTHGTPTLTYCRITLLPIWERWADGDRSMRRAPECTSADPLTHEEQRNRLFATMQQFHGRGESPANMAAKMAAEATLFALMGYPEVLVRQLGSRAEAAHKLALAVVASLPADYQAPE
jgi:hypothetical protein